MTVNSLLSDLALLGSFLLAGFFIREICRPLQRLFIPSCVIGGVLALLLGPQVLGLVEIPASFSQLSGSLIRLVMTGLVFGVAIDRQKIASYADYMMAVHSVYGGQMALGVLLGAGLCIVWPDLPTGWGLQGVMSFYGGHGTAGATGAVFEELGVEGVTGIGMVLSTFGLIIAMVFGMMVVNYGVRKGWATYVKEPQKQPDSFYCGPLPADARKPIGVQVTNSISINALALQLGWLLFSMWFGTTMLRYVGMVLPIANSIPLLTHGIIGAAVLYPILRALKMDRYVDKKSISELSGLSLEILILGSMATLNIQIVTTFLLPLLIFSAILCGATILYALWSCRTFCKNEWFEKACFIIGQSTGATPTGLALVRAIDPDSVASPPEAHGVYNGLTFWTSLFTAFLPPTLMVGIGAAVGAGFIQFAVCFLIGFFYFARRKQKTAAGK